jgi:hypothetical protein
MFLLYIDFIDYLEYFNKILNFIKYNNNNSNSKNLFNKNFINDSKLIEKVSIRWISFDTLISCIEKKKTNNINNTISLREVFLSTLRISKDQLIFIQSK